jgi:rhomboid protease GluP
VSYKNSLALSQPSSLRATLMPRGWLDNAPVTRGLLTLNFAIFLVQAVLTGGRSLLHLPQREALAFGASYAFATVGEGRWETLVTACFLHDGLLHVSFNMLLLWQAGPIVEKNVGSARMAPLYLVAGVVGNLVSVAWAWRGHVPQQVSLGASGAITGVLAAALVLGIRLQGWRGPLAQAMLRWLLFVLAFGILSSFTGGHIDNAAHIGGAVAGAVIAVLWRRGYRYSERTSRAVLGVCAGLLAVCVGIVSWHDRTDPFARMDLQERDEFTERALAMGHCRDAHDGLEAVERLRSKLAPVPHLRETVESECGHVNP